MSIEGERLVYELLHRGRRYTYATTLAAWRERTKAATVVSVANGGVAVGKR